MKSIDKSMIMGEILRMDQDIANILTEAGMHCLGCPSSQVESIEDACSVHGLEVDVIVKKINDYLSFK